MKQRVFIALLFAGLAVWELFGHAWLAPGFALLSASQLAIPAAMCRHLEGRALLLRLVLFLGLCYLGVAYLFALLAGWPTTVGFWAVFGAAVLILGPVFWLGRRVMLGSATH